MVTIQEVWYGDSVSAKLVRILLWPLSCLYALGWQIYLLVYGLKLKRPYKAKNRVICIGNFTAGGTGKTPTTIFVAQCLREIGLQFVIGCSGYGAPHSVGASVAPAGALDASEWGDEPAELRNSLPDVQLIVGRARVEAAKLCDEQFPGYILLMDDGFQHMPIFRDLSIILDPDMPNRMTFPAGPYREPRSAGMKRADLFIPNGEFSQSFSNLTFSTPEGEIVPVVTKARVLTAIGRPDKFRHGLEKAGITILEFIALPDHDKIEVDFSTMDAEFPWIVTRKDWVKIRSHSSKSQITFVIAERTATIEPAEEFKKWLTIKLG
ncbi:MAG: tetraacyldisaccharide 4'-kinase [Armatimonadota bacterium]